MKVRQTHHNFSMGSHMEAQLYKENAQNGTSEAML
jgi:hypothetical protein